MALSPFALIRKGAQGLINEGKSFLDKVAPDIKQNADKTYTPTTSGIVKNTILGLPTATRDTLFPTRGYTEKELIEARPNLSQTAQGAPKVVAELSSGLGELVNMIPGYSSLAYKATNNKAGDALNKAGLAIAEYGNPKNVEEAQAMRVFDVASNFIPFGGSVKNVARSSKVIGGTKDLSLITKELQGLGVPNNVVKMLAPQLVDVSDGKQISDLIQETLTPQTRPNVVSTIIQEGKNSPNVKDDLKDIYYHGTRTPIRNEKGLFSLTNKKEIAENYASGAGGMRKSENMDFQVYEAGDKDGFYNALVEGNRLKYVREDGKELSAFDIESLIRGGQASPKSKNATIYEYEIPKDSKILTLESPNTMNGYNKNTPGTKLISTLDSKGDRFAKAIIDDAKQGRFDWSNTKYPNHQKAWKDVLIPQLESKGYQGIKYNDEGDWTTAVFDVSKLKNRSTKSPAIPETSAKLGTGEQRTLERAAEMARGEAEANSGTKLPSFEETIAKSTPVDKKVGVLDYWRTPENVLEKIGLGEDAKVLRTQYDKYIKELPVEINKITEWSKRVPPESNVRIFKYLDGQAIDLNPNELKVADEIKSYLSEWADKLGLPEDQRVGDYITRLFDDQLVKKEFDDDLAKIIRDRIPGEVYNPFMESRLGAKGYKEDTWAALDAYVKRATRKVNLDPALDKIKISSKDLEDSQWAYVKKYVDKVNMRPTEFDNLVDNSLKQSPLGYRLGQRPVNQISRALRQTAFRGMIGANIGSALRNLSQGVNTYAKLGERYTATGYMNLLRKGTKELEEVGVLADNFVVDRKLSATKGMLQKLDKGLFALFDAAEKVNRGSAYYGAKAKALDKGMSEAEAIDYAKKIVRDTQFNYGSIDTPVTGILSSDIGKVFAQFLTYPVKQTEFLTGMAKNKEYMGIARYVLGGLALTYTLGQAIGMRPTDFIPFWGQASGEQKFGTPPSLKLPAEIIKAGLNVPDKYGNVPDTTDKLKNIGNAAWGVLPGGVQLKKTIEGANTLEQGGEFTKSGDLKFEAPQDLVGKIQTLILGKNSSQNAKDYFKKDQTAESKRNKIEPVYAEVQKLKDSGDEAGAIALYKALDDEQKEAYQDLRSKKKLESTTQGKKDITPTFLRIRALKEEGNTEEALAEYKKLDKEQRRVYQLMKKQFEKD